MMLLTLMLTLMLLFADLTVHADVCMSNGYTCQYNGTVCYDRTCPVCDDITVANNLINQLNILNTTLSSNNVSSFNMSSVLQVYNIIKNDISYCQSSFIWPKEYDKGGVCQQGWHTCTSSINDWITCYQKDCVICQSGKICAYINNDLETIYSTMKTNNFTSQGDPNAMSIAYTQISNTILYCDQYTSSAVNIAVYYYTLVIMLFTVLISN
jgi:hypothetical protein